MDDGEGEDMEDLPEPEEGGDDEEDDPIKTIQKWTGKLSQKIRKAKDEVESDNIRYVFNSLLASIDPKEQINSDDRKAIIKKLKGEDKEEEDMEDLPEPEEGGDDDVDIDIGGDEEAEPAPEDKKEDVEQEDFAYGGEMKQKGIKRQQGYEPAMGKPIFGTFESEEPTDDIIKESINDIVKEKAENQLLDLVEGNKFTKENRIKIAERVQNMDPDHKSYYTKLMREIIN